VRSCCLQFRKARWGGQRFGIAPQHFNQHDRRMLHRAALLIAVLIATTPCYAATTGTLSATYDGYSHGVIALRVTASFDLTPGAYSGRLEFHTAGMIGWMVHTESDSQVVGRFAPSPAIAAQPTSFDSTGVMHGTDRVTHMIYQDGLPVLKAIAPPPEQERTAVPQAETAHTIDTLSAIVQLMRQVGQTGKCDGAATTYDGRRLTALTARTVGEESLPPAHRLGFDGQALRCDFVGTQLAGFMKGRDEDQLRRPRHGSAWLAQLVAGAPPVPVQVVFEHQALGEVTLHLTSISGSPGVVAQIK
jgi:hypothetical protein